MNLYDYNHALDALIDAETGEILDYDAFLTLALERDAKIENTAVLIKNLEAEAALIKSEEAALKARRGPMERWAARLKEYLSNYLNGARFDCPRASLSFRKSAALNVSDAASVPVRWVRQRSIM